MMSQYYIILTELNKGDNLVFIFILVIATVIVCV